MSFLKYFIIPLSLLSTTQNVLASDEENKQVPSSALTVTTQDYSQLNISFNVPLMSVLSFDHEPQTSAQTEEYSNLLGTFTQKLLATQDLFQFNPESECALKSFNHFTNFESTPASIRFDIQYDCKNPDKIKSLALNAFTTFPGISSVNAQYFNGTKNVNTVLTRDALTLLLDENA